MPGLRTNKKQDIIQAATLLFAAQGFDGTTTLQISKKARITEPVIYYHFTGKDELFTGIMSETFARYYAHLDGLPQKTLTAFEKIANLIALHLDIVEEMPDQIYLAASACPARLKDPDGVCRRNIETMNARLKNYLTGCLEIGIATGEFYPVDLASTVDLLIVLLLGLLRQKGLKVMQIKGIKQTAVDFCRRSLVKTELGHG
jgi:AcrR family transcriptional regulator